MGLKPETISIITNVTVNFKDFVKLPFEFARTDDGWQNEKLRKRDLGRCDRGILSEQSDCHLIARGG